MFRHHDSHNQSMLHKQKEVQYTAVIGQNEIGTLVTTGEGITQLLCAASG